MREAKPLNSRDVAVAEGPRAVEEQDMMIIEG